MSSISSWHAMFTKWYCANILIPFFTSSVSLVHALLDNYMTSDVLDISLMIVSHAFLQEFLFYVITVIFYFFANLMLAIQACKSGEQAGAVGATYYLWSLKCQSLVPRKHCSIAHITVHQASYDQRLMLLTNFYPLKAKGVLLLPPSDCSSVCL